MTTSVIEQKASRPILFSGPMVRVILAGEKTQTRRIVKLNMSGRVARGGKNWHIDDKNASLACPYGQPGDMLWVRETWADVPHPGQGPKCKMSPDGRGATFRADWQGNPSGFKWRPSIHMPRWASRLALEIIGVRMERLRDITRADAKAEGFMPQANGLESWAGKSYGNAQLAFEACWREINGIDSWEGNPLVWVVSFRVA
jgi:hypothetical protein